MFPNGPIWVPPNLDSFDSNFLNKKSENFSEGKDQENKTLNDEKIIESESEENSEDDLEEIEINKKFKIIGKVPFSERRREICNEILLSLDSSRNSMKIVLYYCYENIKNAESIISMIFDILKNEQVFSKKVK